MDLALEQIGHTIAVGSLAVLGVFLLIRMFMPSARPGWLQADGDGAQFTFLWSAAGLALIFGVGVLAEGLAQRYDARRETFIPGTRWIYDGFIGSGQCLRLNILLSDCKCEYEDLAGSEVMVAFSGRPRELLYRVLEKDLLVEFGGRRSEEAQQLIQSREEQGADVWRFTGDEAEVIYSATNSLYYHAANLAFRQPTYFKELSRRASRADFARAFTYVCCSLLMLHLVALLVRLGVGVFGARARKADDSGGSSSPLGELKGYLGFILLLLVLAFWGKGSHYSERLSFNLRAVGYLATLAQESEELPAAPNQTPADSGMEAAE